MEDAAEATLGVRCTELAEVTADEVLSVLGLRCSSDDSEVELGCRWRAEPTDNCEPPLGFRCNDGGWWWWPLW